MEKTKDQCLLWEEEPPVSPTGQYFNSSALSVSVLAVFESEIPIDDSPTVDVLENVFLPINPRFSSIMVNFYLIYIFIPFVLPFLIHCSSFVAFI